MKNKFSIVILGIFLSIFLCSCSDKIMGYSVLLWSVPEYEMQSGDVVPVFIKSNISHVYVAGAPNGEKIELPLWQLTEPQKKGKIKNIAARYQDNANIYASVKIDGLPCRAEAVNTAKQVYRLRKGEVIKILYKVKGQAPMTGGKPLEGDWYRILAKDGTQGCCFSYNLNLYEADLNGLPLGGVAVEEEESDGIVESISDKIWYPDYFDTMIKSGNVDLNRLNTAYQFKIDTENKKVTLNFNKIHEAWDYDGFTKIDDYEYELTGIPVKIVYKNQRFIVLRYTGESGKPEELNFVFIDADLEEVIGNEKARRAQAYLQVWSHGPIYKSSSYGTITFNEDGTFHWSNFKMLVPSVISSTAKNTGMVSVKYAVGKNVAPNYDGVLTFRFSGLDEDVNFLYKLEDGGIRMEDTTNATFNGNYVTARTSSPTIMYFKKN